MVSLGEKSDQSELRLHAACGRFTAFLQLQAHASSHYDTYVWLCNAEGFLV